MERTPHTPIKQVRQLLLDAQTLEDTTKWVRTVAGRHALAAAVSHLRESAHLMMRACGGGTEEGTVFTTTIATSAGPQLWMVEVDTDGIHIIRGYVVRNGSMPTILTADEGLTLQDLLDHELVWSDHIREELWKWVDIINGELPPDDGTDLETEMDHAARAADIRAGLNA